MFIEYENRFDVLNEKPQSVPVELTQAQAIEDLNQYVYLLETSCAGFIEQREKINFQERYNQVLNELKNLPTVKTEYFLMTLLGKLAEGIKDLHSVLFCEINDNNQKINFVRRFMPKTIGYYADCFFTKKDNHFISVDDSSLVLEGEIVNQKTKSQKNHKFIFFL